MTQPERRQARRFRTSDDQRGALLKVGDETIPAELLDQSAAGFALRLETHPGVYEGESVWVNVGGCWTKARVTRVDWDSDRVGLGLARTLETASDPVRPKEPALFRMWRLPKDTGAPLIICVALLITAALVMLAQTAWFEAEESAPTPTPPDVRQTTDVEAGSAATLKEMGASVFLVPDVSEALGLTHQQTERIRGILAEAQRLLNAAGTPKAHEQIRANSLRDARAVLSPAQRAEWDRALSKSAK